MQLKSVLCALALASLLGTAQAEEYSFTVNNNSGSKIVRIQVSEDGRNWGDFDIGSGIPAGASSELTWAEHTNDAGCVWQFVASFADGSKSDAVAFDFCEEDLELEFE
ncbi:MAG: hypothetical protein MUE46_13110 [Xanthomonadales bacterium]|jgi:hypothetical protein|nr:hypothetical protein [Xanthomonadales bacterium]